MRRRGRHHGPSGRSREKDGSQLDRRQARADEAAQGMGIRKRRATRRAGPRRKELSTRQQTRAERADTTGGVRAREASSTDGPGGPTRASSDEPGRRQQHDKQRIRTDIAVQGIARLSGRSQREGLWRKELRECRPGETKRTRPCPRRGLARKRSRSKQEG